MKQLWFLVGEKGVRKEVKVELFMNRIKEKSGGGDRKSGMRETHCEFLPKPCHGWIAIKRIRRKCTDATRNHSEPTNPGQADSRAGLLYDAFLNYYFSTSSFWIETNAQSSKEVSQPRLHFR